MSQANLQSRIDHVGKGGLLKLHPARQEFAGPAVIKKPMQLDGEGASISAKRGPVLMIRSKDVTIRNLNVEITGRSTDLTCDERCAVKVAVPGGKGVRFENVTVRGEVGGVPGEEGEWQYPRSVRAGLVGAGEEHLYRVRLHVPGACRFEVTSKQLVAEPSSSPAGPCELTIRVRALAPGDRLRGEIRLCSGVTRRIMVTASAPKTATNRAKAGLGQVVYQAPDWPDSGEETAIEATPIRSAGEVATLMRDLQEEWPIETGRHRKTIKDRVIHPFTSWEISAPEARRRWMELPRFDIESLLDSELVDPGANVRHDQPAQPVSPTAGAERRGSGIPDHIDQSEQPGAGLPPLPEFFEPDGQSNLELPPLVETSPVIRRPIRSLPSSELWSPKPDDAGAVGKNEEVAAPACGEKEKPPTAPRARPKDAPPKKRPTEPPVATPKRRARNTRAIDPNLMEMFRRSEGKAEPPDDGEQAAPPESDSSPKKEREATPESKLPDSSKRRRPRLRRKRGDGNVFGGGG